MKFILAISDNNVIGINNKLPWHIPHDLLWFKMNTYDTNIIMGRKTYDSMPFLPNRTYFVVSSKNHKFGTSIEHLPEGFCIGGAQLVESIIKAGDILYLTHISMYISDPKAIFINLPKKKLLWKTKRFMYNHIEYYFAAYKILNNGTNA